jgi:hypothetical protein
MRGPIRLRTLIPVALAALMLPASAAAHGRTATIALDYRLALDRSTRDLPGVQVRILDGDRDLQVAVDPGTVLLVRGALGEGMLRIDRSGVWANAGSPTATGDKVVSAAAHGWVRLSGGLTVAWHDHRLSPPPATTVGPVGRFVVPVVVNGVPAAISGTFFRVARPPLWPWALAALVLVGAIVVAIRRRGLRAPLTIGLGVAAGIAALVEVTTFAVSDAPTGGVAWLQVITAFVVAAVLGAFLVRLRGRSRVHAAGVFGAVAAAVSLGSTPVFWHGVVISALPALGARAACWIAIVAGVAAACLSFLRDFDEPARLARPAARVRRPLPR